MGFYKHYFRESGSPSDSRFLFNEGGSHGHINHPYEDDSLTFSELKDMMKKVLFGEIDIVEKSDGMQISFSYINDKIVFARNKGHIKNSGENALSVDDVAQMFSGRGDILDAFLGASKDLVATFAGVSDQLLSKWFMNGRRFMSVEIIYSATKNVISYDGNYIVPHCVIEYSQDGNSISEDDDLASEIFEYVGDGNMTQFSIMMPNKAQIDSGLVNMVYASICKAFDGLSSDPDMTVGEYRRLHGSVDGLDELFLKFGTLILNNINSYMVSDIDSVVDDIKNRIQDKISELENSSDGGIVIKLKKQVDRLNIVGGVDSVVPTEGLVFKYKNKKYKLTGSFAPVNRILNLR